MINLFNKTQIEINDCIEKEVYHKSYDKIIVSVAPSILNLSWNPFFTRSLELEIKKDLEWK